MQLILQVEKPTAPIYFQKKIQNHEKEWKGLYIFLKRGTINTNICIFQYKLLHNILYLDEILYKFGIKALFYERA